MVFQETPLPGAYVVEIERRSDPRGFFARAWCARELEQAGVSVDFVQANIGYSARRGTLRGLHLQVAPHGETKLVRCTRGAIYDVAVDLRPDSPAYLQWVGVELTAENHRMLLVPEGCAHGYLSLSDDAEVFYAVSAYYHPAAERGYRYDDPAFGIDWPEEVRVVSEKDLSWAPYESLVTP